MKIEIILVLLILFAQIYIFLSTYKQINLFKKIIPNIDALSILRIHIPKEDLEKKSPKEILASLYLYSIEYTTKISEEEASQDIFLEGVHSNSTIEMKEISIINSTINDNEIIDKILFSINNYLIRNYEAATDFNLIKDIVERNINTVEEDINLSIGIPLYLGLMGTMMGIVIALFNMPELNVELGTTDTGIMLDKGISMLIGGVKIAMIASFVGLFLTIINSGWIFKSSRLVIESRKSDFYTFIQIELLPLINNSLASTLGSLQRNLLKFNDEFSTNLVGLSAIFGASRDSIRDQKELILALDKAKVSEMTRYNVSVLKQLDVSVEKFEKFNEYLTNVSQFVENSQLIVGRTNELLERTDNFRVISESLENKLEQSQLLMRFLFEHFDKLEKHKEYTNMTVADVGHTLSKTFEELKLHIQNSSDAVKKFTVDEVDLLKSALSDNSSNLSNLEHLATLKSDIASIKDSSNLQSERLYEAVGELNKNISKSISILEQIEKKESLILTVKKLFKSKKAINEK